MTCLLMGSFNPDWCNGPDGDSSQGAAARSILSLPIVSVTRESDMNTLAPGVCSRRPRTLATAFLGKVAWVLVSTAAICVASVGSAQDLASLPAYEPGQKVTGVLRIYGSPLAGLVRAWEDGFRAFHPKVRFQDDLASSDAWIGGLMAGVADIAASGRETMLSENLAFFEVFGIELVEIPVATGAAATQGRTYELAIFVHKDNPLTQLTMEQLDGIFGAERTGGYEGFRYTKAAQRGPERNLRTWGELGLKGEWQNKTINTYGFAWSGMTNFFQRIVFNGGEKWNPNYRGYVQTGTKMVGDDSLTTTQMFRDLSKDRFGIAWAGTQHGSGFDQVKILALAKTPNGPFVLPTKRTVQDRSYPLARVINMAIRCGDGQPIDLRVKEFLRYVLSSAGQKDVVKHGVYEPLTAEMVQVSRKKLD